MQLNTPQLPIDFTVHQVAEMLVTTERTIREALKKGDLEYYKLSKRNTRITAIALEKFKNKGGISGD